MPFLYMSTYDAVFPNRKKFISSTVFTVTHLNHLFLWKALERKKKSRNKQKNKTKHKTVK